MTKKRRGADRKRGKGSNQDRLSDGPMEAVFLVPFGQNGKRIFADETERRTLCTSANVRSLLVAFANPRFYQPDLDSLKAELSNVVRSLHLDFSNAAIQGSPILSTPDGYLRHERIVWSTDTSKLPGCLSDEVSVACGGSATEPHQTLRRLVCPQSDMHPILTTNAVSVGLFNTLPPRDLNLCIWQLFARTVVEPNSDNKVLSFGLPLLFPPSKDHTQFHVVPDMNEPWLRDAMEQLYLPVDGSENPMKQSVTWENGPMTELSDHPLNANVIIYDPVVRTRGHYRDCFELSRMESLAAMCKTHLANTGYLIVFMEEAAGNPSLSPLIDRPDAPVQKILSYTVPDSIMSDPPTVVYIFQSTRSTVINGRDDVITKLDELAELDELISSLDADNETLNTALEKLRAAL